MIFYSILTAKGKVLQKQQQQLPEQAKLEQAHPSLLPQDFPAKATIPDKL